jgi:Protein of unknown function (DUF4019)
MKYFVICLCGLFLLMGAGLDAAQKTGKEKAAVAAAEKWLSLIDSEKYEQSWKGAAQYFKNFISEENWVQRIKAVKDGHWRVAGYYIK